MEERIEGLKIAYVGNNLLNLGFKIAGVTESHTVTEVSQTESIMKELMSRADVGVIIMTSAARRMVKDRRLSDSISTSLMPLIVEVPELNEPLAEEETLRNLILRAIGIDITKTIR
ncbi:MAG: hypothetical protein KGH72_02900 [Candidatus Micrarchaeota archaeon]|nr:hypothetical protein [Candidatus Micrarchaeota archaeon]